MKNTRITIFFKGSRSRMSEELRRGIPKAIVTGEVKTTVEEREKYDCDFEKILKEYGVLKENQFIKDGKILSIKEDIEE